MVDVCFFQTRSRYISAINWYMSTIDVDEINFGLLIDFDLLKARTSTNTKPEVVLCARSRHLEKSIWRDIFAVDDPEWHDSNGDEVKIETEKSDGLKAINFSLVVRACKSQMLFLCNRLRFGRSWTSNLLTVNYLYWHTIRTASQTNLQPCRRNGRQHLAKTIRVN